MSDSSGIPHHWKFATFQENGTILIEWRIREPFSSTGVIVLEKNNSNFHLVLERLKNSPPGMRVSISTSIEDLAKQAQEEKKDPKYKQFLEENADVLEEYKKQ